MIRDSKLWWFALVLAGVFVVGVAVAPRLKPQLGEGGSTSLSRPSQETRGTVLGNAFMPSGRDRLTREEDATAGAVPRSPSPSTPASPFSYTVTVPTFEQIQEKVAAALLPPSSPEETVPLPAVADGELMIDPAGVRTLDDYIVYFVAHSREVRFDAKRFRTVRKDDQGIELLPVEVVEQALRNGDFAATRSSLLSWQDFTLAKIDFLKKIKVYGEALAPQKKMIGFDRLTLSLIEKALAAERDPAVRPELASFIKKFRATATYENGQFVRQFQIFAQERSGSFFSRVLGFFGLLNPALAANPPFGATLGQPFECECENGYWIPVSGPVVPPTGALFVPMTFSSSPLFFAFKTMRAGVWWLGLYTATPSVCTDPEADCVDVIRTGSPIFMTGASN